MTRRAITKRLADAILAVDVVTGHELRRWLDSAALNRRASAVEKEELVDHEKAVRSLARVFGAWDIKVTVDGVLPTGFEWSWSEVAR